MNRNLSGLLIIITVFSLWLSSCRKNPEDKNTGVDYSDCLIEGTSTTLDIVTFNTETYPKSGEETAKQLANLIKQMNVDLIALQEISSEEELDKLAERLIGWEAEFYPINNSIWNLAYLYKVSEVSIDKSKSKVIFDDDFWAFPRPPFEIHISHSSTGLDIIMLNNHFKCCGGSDNEERRRNAADSLHRYVSSTYPDQNVIILGDLNDEIHGDSYETNVFWSIIDDSENFMFADMDIAIGPPTLWSYPSWPSHIDHICVTDELFDNIDITTVITADDCYDEYTDIISDHRPVYLRLN